MKRMQHLMFALLAGALGYGVAGMGTAVAQSFPTRPVAIVVPFPPGGAMDTLARSVAEKMTARLGQSVIVENRAGAGGITGTAYVARMAPDGHTLLIASHTQYAALPNLRADVGFDPVRSFAPVSQIAFAPPTWLVSRADLPVTNLKELVAYAKANPGKLNFGSDGLGTSTHVNFEHLKRAAGIDIVHIPFQGTSPSLAALLSGQIDIAFMLVLAPLPHIQSGKLRAIANASPMRLEPDKNLPTVEEQGYPGFYNRGWYGIVAPAGTPKDAVDRLNRDLLAVTKEPDFIKRMAPFGIEITGTSPGVLAEAIRNENATWAKIAADLDLKKLMAQ